LTLPLALRFNQPVAAEAIERFGQALGTDDPADKVEELARLGGFERLRDLGIPEDAPAEVAEAVAARPGAKANPRPVTPADVQELLRSIW
jgi:alcohol dehydrogenase class IV